MSHNRRVGTLTAGLVLVIFGVLFLLRTFIPALDFRFIFSCWPVVLILLGLELLFSRFGPAEERLRYDGAAIFLVLVMAGFAMGMACVQFLMENLPAEVWNYFR